MKSYQWRVSWWVSRSLSLAVGWSFASYGDGLVSVHNNSDHTYNSIHLRRSFDGDCATTDVNLCSGTTKNLGAGETADWCTVSYYAGERVQVLSNTTQVACEAMPSSGPLHIDIGGGGAPSYTNYWHHIYWTNDTGVAKAGYLETGDTNSAPIWVGPNGIVDFWFTNSSAVNGELGIREYVGQPFDDWAVSGGSSGGYWVATNTAAGHGAQGSVQQGGVQVGGYWVPWTNYLGTNLVLTLGQPGYGSTTSAVSQADYYLGVDASTRGIVAGLDEVRAAIVESKNTTSNMLAASSSAGTSNLLAGVTNALAGLSATIAAGLGGTGTNAASNMFGAALSVSGGLTAGSNAYNTSLAGPLGQMNGAVGTWSNVPSGWGVETGLRVQILTDEADPDHQSVLDLRPSAATEWALSAWAAGKAVAAWLVLACLYVAMWVQFMEVWNVLHPSAVASGRQLTSATVEGLTVGYPVKVMVANVVTVGLAGLPTFFVTCLGTFGVTGGLASSPLQVVSSAAGGASVGVAAALIAVWSLVSAFFPWETLMVAVINFFVFRSSMVLISSLWMTIYRYLPLLPLAFLPVHAMQAHAVTVIFDNRCAVPAGILSGGDIQWLPQGERLLDLPSSVTVTVGGATNNLNVVFGSEEVQRLIVYESSGDIGYTLAGEYGFNWGLNRGLVVGFALCCVWIVSVFIRGFLKPAFGHFSE